MTNPAPRAQKPGNTLSNILAVVAAVFAILAVVLYLRPNQGIAPIPTAAPGRNELINVVQALKAQDLPVTQPQGLFVPAGTLSVPGQGLQIDGAPAFVFLFPDAGTAQGSALTGDPAAIIPDALRGTPTPGGERRLTQNSNVVLVMIGGDDTTWHKVETAIAGLA